MKKKRNPIPTIDVECIICGRPYAATHEVFYGNPDARHSQDYGLTVRLCYDHHQHHKTGVHFYRAFDLKLKQEFKAKFELENPELKFSDIFNTAWMQEVE